MTDTMGNNWKACSKFLIIIIKLIIHSFDELLLAIEFQAPELNLRRTLIIDESENEPWQNLMIKLI